MIRSDGHASQKNENFSQEFERFNQKFKAISGQEFETMSEQDYNMALHNMSDKEFDMVFDLMFDLVTDYFMQNTDSKERDDHTYAEESCSNINGEQGRDIGYPDESVSHDHVTEYSLLSG